MKHASILFLLIALAVRAATAQPSTGLPGDANCDQQINAADISAVIAVIFGAPVVCPEADVNGDGRVTVADVTGVEPFLAAPAPTPTATGTPTSTTTPTPSPVPTATPTPTATHSPTATSTETAAATITPTLQMTSTPTETGTPTTTGTAPSTPTISPTSTQTTTPTVTGTPTASAPSSFTATATQSTTSTMTAAEPSSPTTTAIHTETPTATATTTATDSPTPSATHTRTPTPSSTPTHTPTATRSATPTATATMTPTDSPTPSATHTHTPTPSSTPTFTATVTRSATPTATATMTPTNPPTPSDTPTRTPTPSGTPTWTATASLTPTLTPLGIRHFVLDPATNGLAVAAAGGTIPLGGFHGQKNGVTGLPGYLDLQAGQPDDNGVAIIDVVGASDYLYVDATALVQKVVCIKPLVPISSAGLITCAGGLDFSVEVTQNHHLGEIGINGFTVDQCTSQDGTIEGANQPHPGVCNGPFQVSQLGGDTGPGAVSISPIPTLGLSGLLVEINFEDALPCGDEGAGDPTALAVTSAAFRSQILNFNNMTGICSGTTGNSCTTNADCDSAPGAGDGVCGATLVYDSQGMNFSCANWQASNGPGCLVFSEPQLDANGTSGTDDITAFAFCSQ